MSLRITVNQNAVRGLIVDMKDARDGAAPRVAKVMEATGPTLVRTARRVVPVDTGSLYRRIWYKVYTSGPNPRMRFGPMNSSPDRRGSDKNALEYAGYVHDGTASMGPRPFIDQAVAKHTTPQGKFMRGLRAAGVARLGRSTGGYRP
jgi:hypothetical protein